MNKNKDAYYYSSFKNTDVSKQLRESFVPESCYLYVEHLWNSNKEMKLKLKRIREEIENHDTLIQEILE